MSHDPLSGLTEDLPESCQSPPGDEGGDSTISEGQASGRLALPESMTIADMAELQSLMVAALQGKSEVAIEGASVELVDGAGLQLLAALFKTAAQQGVTLAWISPSVALVEGSAQIGLASALGLEAEEVA